MYKILLQNTCPPYLTNCVLHLLYHNHNQRTQTKYRLKSHFNQPRLSLSVGGRKLPSYNLPTYIARSSGGEGLPLLIIGTTNIISIFPQNLKKALVINFDFCPTKCRNDGFFCLNPTTSSQFGRAFGLCTYLHPRHLKKKKYIYYLILKITDEFKPVMHESTIQKRHHQTRLGRPTLVTVQQIYSRLVVRVASFGLTFVPLPSNVM